MPVPLDEYVSNVEHRWKSKSETVRSLDLKSDAVKQSWGEDERLHLLARLVEALALRC